MDMRFYWVCNQVRQGQFIIYWKKGTKHNTIPSTRGPQFESAYKVSGMCIEAGRHRLYEARLYQDHCLNQHMQNRACGQAQVRTLAFALNDQDSVPSCASTWNHFSYVENIPVTSMMTCFQHLLSGFESKIDSCL